MGVPSAEGQRAPFGELPEAIRARVAEGCGGRIDLVRDAASGFSPGVAAAVAGPAWQCFVKAVHIDANPDTPGIHRREAEVLLALVDTEVVAPRLHWWEETDGWVVLVLDRCPGRNPELPWSAPDVDVLLRTLTGLHRTGTPCPIADLASADEVLGDSFEGWRTLAGEATARPGLPSWVNERVDGWAEIERTWPDAAAGDSLLHLDVRGDNLLVHDGVGTFVDWPWAARGHPLLDLVAAAPALAMQGGPAPEALLSRAGWDPATHHERLVPLAVAAVGMFVDRGSRPPPPGLPTLRPFQAAQGAVGLAWLDRLTR